MKLAVRTIDFETLVKELPMANPLNFVLEDIFEYHQESLVSESKRTMKGSE